MQVKSGREEKVLGLALLLALMIHAPVFAGTVSVAEAVASTEIAAAQAPVEQPVPVRSVIVSPDRGVVRAPFTVSLDGLAEGQTVRWDWLTWDGSYATNPTAETVEYERRTLVERRVTLGTSTADNHGMAAASFMAPEDFGEVHSIFAVVNDVDVGRGGFRIQLSASLTPSEGPIGTPVQVRVTGMAAKLFSGTTLAMRWDNTYTGLLTATTTQGTATARIRASGPPGQHFVVLNAGTTPAYLNIHQSPYDFVYAHLPNQEELRLPFSVTGDAGPPPDQMDWPDASRVAALESSAARTTANLAGDFFARAELSPGAGPVLSRTALNASGLSAGEEVRMWWVTARGNRVTPSGWSLADIPLPSGQASADGTLTAAIEVPDDLGGWHVLKLAQGDQIVAEAPFYVERSLVEVSARRVRAGDTVNIHVKGIGWTELDNGFAMTYDNAHIGYACGFNSNGDVMLTVLATGAPGTHLVDLYPMVYDGHDAKDWYWAPVLTYAEDFPALGLGYRLPAIRIAIEIV